MLWKQSCGGRITDLINASFPKTSNSRAVTGKEPNHISRSQSSGNTRKLINPRKSTSPKALETQRGCGCNHLLIHPFNSISSQTFWSLDLFPPLQMTRKPQELHRARSCDRSNSCLYFGFRRQQRGNCSDCWKRPQQIPKSSSVGAVGTSTGIPGFFPSSLQRRGGGGASTGYFLRPMGQETPVPPRPQYPPGFLLRYCWWYSSA